MFYIEVSDLRKEKAAGCKDAIGKTVRKERGHGWRSDDRKGEVFIRTRFREQHESEYRLSREEMIKDEAWREAVGAEGGPFCYTDQESPMPF